jgi:uncharacterized protein
MSELTIQVLDVREKPRRFRLESDLEWWLENRAALRDPDATLLEPFVMDLEAYSLGKRLFFRGPVSGRVELPCGRCLEPYAHSLSDRIELLLEPLADSQLRADGFPKGGIALDPDDLEIARYAGDELDFGVVLLELLLFSWPMQPRCAEACLGLCPSCGANRNREPCRCAVVDGDRPFRALDQLLEQRKGRSS